MHAPHVGLLGRRSEIVKCSQDGQQIWAVDHNLSAAGRSRRDRDCFAPNRHRSRRNEMRTQSRPEHPQVCSDVRRKVRFCLRLKTATYLHQVLRQPADLHQRTTSTSVFRRILAEWRSSPSKHRAPSPLSMFRDRGAWLCQTLAIIILESGCRHMYETSVSLPAASQLI